MKTVPLKFILTPAGHGTARLWSDFPLLPGHSPCWAEGLYITASFSSGNQTEDHRRDRGLQPPSWGPCDDLICLDVAYPELLILLSDLVIQDWLVRWSQHRESGEEDVEAAFEFGATLVRGQHWCQAA